MFIIKSIHLIYFTTLFPDFFRPDMRDILRNSPGVLDLVQKVKEKKKGTKYVKHLLESSPIQFCTSFFCKLFSIKIIWKCNISYTKQYFFFKYSLINNLVSF